MTKTIGVIGLGSIGIRHANNLKALGHRVIGYDPANKGTDKETLLNDIMESCDAIVIASPTDTHAYYLAQCAQSGRPVFVEKPLADKWIDVNAVMVGYNLRFHPCILQAKAWIERGFLGKMLWSNLVCAQLNTKYNDNVILNWSHEIDLALYLIGPAKVKAAAGSQALADLVLLHDNGCQSSIHLDYLTVPWIRQTIIVGADASIIIDIQARHAWLRSATGTMMDSEDDSGSSFDDDYRDEMETFIARLDGQETAGCAGREGLEVLKICLEAQKLLR